MAGTKAGGIAAAATNKKKYGADFYSKIGKKGGTVGTTGGFYSAVCNCNYDHGFQHKKAECAGAVGGSKSRRRKVS